MTAEGAPTIGTAHNPVLLIFQMAANDGSIQAGGPYYKCMTCGGRVMALTDEQGREQLVHVSPADAPMFEVLP